MDRIQNNLYRFINYLYHHFDAPSTIYLHGKKFVNKKKPGGRRPPLLVSTWTTGAKNLADYSDQLERFLSVWLAKRCVVCHLSAAAATLPPPVFLPIKLPRHKYLGTGAQLLLRFNEKWKKQFLIWWSSRTLKQKFCFLFPLFPVLNSQSNWANIPVYWHSHNALTEEPPKSAPIE